MGVSSVNSNSAMSSIYGNRNVLSGLASGMDTESMIENAISGMQVRIQNLQRGRTKTEWKMEAMRNISDSMVQFARKYTSYTSSTNLLSPSFFDKAVITSTMGANKDFVTASGRSNSDIKIKGIDQLATSARYAMKSGGVLSTDSGVIKANGDGAADATGVVDLLAEKPVSTVDGMLTINYGKKQVSINFDELELFENNDKGTAAENMAAAIKTKLGEEKIIMTDGSQKTASDLIGVNVSSTGEISFSDLKNAGNSVYISSVSGNFGKKMDIKTGEDSKSFQVPTDAAKLVDKSKTALEYLSGKSMKVTWNGISKNIAMPEVKRNDDGTYQIGDSGPINADNKKEITDAFVDNLQKSLDRSFGAKNVFVSNAASEEDANAGTMQLQFSTYKPDETDESKKKGNTLAIESKFGSVLGMSDSETSYLNTGKKLGDLLKDKLNDFKNARIEANLDTGKEPEEIKDKDNNTLYFRDKDGNRVVKEDGKWYLADSEDSPFYNLEINGVSIGKYSKNTALETVMVDINNNADAGVKVSYSKLTNEMVFSAKETGAGGQIEIKSDDGNNLAAAIFGEIAPPSDGNDSLSTADNRYTFGKDAKLKVEINGSDMDLVRSTNNFDLEGMSVTLKGTFTAATDADAITFKTESDTDKIVDAVKSMVEDYNEMIKGIKDAYSTMPAVKANKTRYEPLTDEEAADLSETALKNYEEKAKQGILFGDQDLSSLYGKLRNVFSASGADGSFLRKIGITTNYSSGLTTVELDENALRDALNSNPDAVKDAFTKTKGTGGSASDGIMQGLKTQLDAYASTTGAYKGILIEKAGSKYSATSLMSNSFQKELDAVDKNIEKWQDKISDRVDYYTKKFSRLEQLISQMNSQSSYLMSLQSGG